MPIFLRHNHEDLCEAHHMTNLLEQAISCDDGDRAAQSLAMRRGRIAAIIAKLPELVPKP